MILTRLFGSRRDGISFLLTFARYCDRVRAEQIHNFPTIHKEFAMRIYIVLLAMFAAILVTGCGSSATFVDDTNWEEELPSYPNSLYWNALGEAESRDMQTAIDKAAALARARILNTMGKTSATLRFSCIVRFRTWSRGEPEARIHHAKVLVSAPKSLNPGVKN